MLKVTLTFKSGNGTEFTRNVNTCLTAKAGARVLHKQYKGFDMVGYEVLASSKFVTGNEMVINEKNFTHYTG